MRVERIERLTEGFEMMLRLAEPEIFLSNLPEVIYGAFDDDNRPCGIVTAAVTPDRLLIKKLYVYPDSRTGEAGEMLLRAVWKHTLDIGMRNLSYLYGTLKDEECIYANALARVGFGAPTDICDALMCTARAAKLSRIYIDMSHSLPAKDRIVDLGDVRSVVNESAIPEAVTTMIADDRMFSMVPGDKGSFSPAYISGKEGVVAAILTANRGHYVHISQIFLKSPKYAGMLPSLFSTLTDVYCRSYGSDELKFLIYFPEGEKMKIFETLLGDAPFERCTLRTMTKFADAEPAYPIRGEKEFMLKAEMLSDELSTFGVAHKLMLPNNEFPYVIIEQGKTVFRLNYFSDDGGKTYIAEMTTDNLKPKKKAGELCREITQTYTAEKLMYASHREVEMNDVEETVNAMVIPFLKLYE